MVIGFLAAVPIGTLVGTMFGPLRLAGVDYGKWYRDPGEVSEMADRSWIGLMKEVALYTARRFIGIVVAAALGGEVLDVLARWARRLPLVHWSEHLPRDFDILTPLQWWHCDIIGGLIVGIIVAQAAVEVAWRIGLRATGHSAHIRLSREPKAERAPTSRAPTKRRLIVCCDGTWNSPYEARETNVVQLLRAIKPVATNGITQIAYYHLGVGTGNIVDRFLGGGAGVGLSSSVKSCYGFLVDNYQDGDDILLFGFSRGAYVVRSLGGLIGCVGLLKKNEMFRFDEAWNYYALRPAKRNADDLNAVAPDRRTTIEISCVGVWDTVGAFGVPGTKLCSSTYAFHDTSLGSSIRHAFQALAMDERRGNFQPAIWVRSDQDQVLEQVWFPGVHSDIGGGYLQHGFSDASMLWMLGRLNRYALLDLNTRCLKDAIYRNAAEVYAIGTLHDSRSRGWKLIAGPVPRPVGITDRSERVHESAYLRVGRPHDIPREDPYRRRGRIAWIRTLPGAAPRSAFELTHAFCGNPPGTVYRQQIKAKCGVCAWAMRWIFGGA